MNFRASNLSAAVQVANNRVALAALRAKYGARQISATDAAIGTVLSQPLRPAMPDPDPHPLRFGWIFESLPLNEREQASVKLHQPAALARD